MKKSVVLVVVALALFICGCQFASDLTNDPEYKELMAEFKDKMGQLAAVETEAAKQELLKSPEFVDFFARYSEMIARNALPENAMPWWAWIKDTVLAGLVLFLGGKSVKQRRKNTQLWAAIEEVKNGGKKKA